jgi:hypothetical protein
MGDFFGSPSPMSRKHELEEMRERRSRAELEADMRKRGSSAWAQEEIEESEARSSSKQAKKQSIELDSLRKRDEEARKKEMEFLRQSQEFENMKKNQAFELEKAKMEERKRVEEESKKQAEERAKFDNDKMRLEYEKRMAEMQKQLEMTQKAVEDANRKANQWSMQIQWEIQEDALKELLEANFPMDNISDVEKWIKWADIIQEVRNDERYCRGSHRLGSRRIRKHGVTHGSRSWRKIASVWMPMSHPRDSSIAERSRQIRSLQVSLARLSGHMHSRSPWCSADRSSRWHTSARVLVSKDEKMEVLYNYLTSAKFKDKVENIIDAFRQMQGPSRRRASSVRE